MTSYIIMLLFYTSQNCYKTCYQREVIARCGCGDSYYPLTGKALGDVTVGPCVTTNREQGKALFTTEQS